MGAHIRLPKDVVDRIDAQAKELGVSRAALLRSLVQTGLGDDVQMAVLREAFYRLGPLLNRCVAYAARQVYDRLPELIEEELTAVNNPEGKGGWSSRKPPEEGTLESDDEDVE